MKWLRIKSCHFNYTEDTNHNTHNLFWEENWLLILLIVFFNKLDQLENTGGKKQTRSSWMKPPPSPSWSCLVSPRKLPSIEGKVWNGASWSWTDKVQRPEVDCSNSSSNRRKIFQPRLVPPTPRSLPPPSALNLQVCSLKHHPRLHVRDLKKKIIIIITSFPPQNDKGTQRLLCCYMRSRSCLRAAAVTDGLYHSVNSRVVVFCRVL